MRVYKSKPIFFFQRGRRALGALVLGPPLDIWLRKQIYFNCKRNSKNNDLHSADENEFKYENVPLSNKLKKMKLLLKNLILEISEGSEVVNVLPQFQSQQEKKWSDDQ